MVVGIVLIAGVAIAAYRSRRSVDEIEALLEPTSHVEQGSSGR